MYATQVTHLLPARLLVGGVAVLCVAFKRKAWKHLKLKRRVYSQAPCRELLYPEAAWGLVGEVTKGVGRSHPEITPRGRRGVSPMG